MRQTVGTEGRTGALAKGAPSGGIWHPRGGSTPPPSPCGRAHFYAPARHVVVGPKRHGAGPRTPLAYGDSATQTLHTDFGESHFWALG